MGPKNPNLSEPIRTKKYFCGAYWHSSPSADDNGIGQSENTYRQIVPNSTKLDQTRHQSLRLSNPQSAIRTPQLTTPQRVVVAAQAATNSGTKTAPIFAVSFYGSVDFQPLTEIREPPAVPCAPAFSSVQSSRFKVQGSKFPASTSFPRGRADLSRQSQAAAEARSEGGKVRRFPPHRR